MSRAARGLRVLRRARHSAPSRLLTADFNYALPPERIAQEAAEPRDASKLLVRASSSSHHDLTFRQLPSLLRGTGAHLVLNESAVFAARSAFASTSTAFHRELRPAESAGSFSGLSSG